MGRQKKWIWFPHDVTRMSDILALILDTHAAGFAVLCGRYDWPTVEELAEMITLSRSSTEDVGPVQGGKKTPYALSLAESLDAARDMYRFLDKFGGKDNVKRAMEEYRISQEHNYNLLYQIGMAGMPGAKSIEAIAGASHMDIKTLYATKATALTEIAFDVVFSNENFGLKPDEFKELRQYARPARIK